MQQYQRLVRRVLEHGEDTPTRPGINARTVFGEMMQFDLREGFPILTTKKVLWDTVVAELLWFLSGGTNINDPGAPKKIWDAWADEHGDLGRIYSAQWRGWQAYEKMADGNYEASSIDQIALAVNRVKHFPNSRRNIVSAWNVGEVEGGICSFPPCHTLWQLRRFGEFLDLALYQRSADVALGLPFNIASYSLLLSMIAHECGLTPRFFIHFIGDCHIYENHLAGLKTQLGRIPGVPPTLRFSCPIGTPVVEMTKDMIHLDNYNPQPFIKFEVAV